jgi:linoleoyl-CoA desaturase
MRDRHIHITQDSELLKSIYLQVNNHLSINKRNFALKIGIKFIFYLSISIYCYYLLFIVVQPLFFVMSFILYGIVSLLFAFNFSHDFSHNTIFKSKRLNNLCFILIFTILGAHAEAWKQRHINSHHYAPNVEGYDSDLKITKLIRVIPNSPYFWYHKYQHIYAPFAYLIYSLFWIFIKDFVIIFTKDEYTEHKDFTYHLSFWIQKIFYLTFILVLPLLFSSQEWYVIIIAFVLMHFVLSFFMLFTFFMTHHVESTTYPTTDKTGIINTSWVMNQIKSSNDMHPFSETANFILGGFNNHIAHHLFPHIHHIHYPKINKVLYPILINNHIKPNHTTYWGGIVSHLKLLKRLGRFEKQYLQ